MNEDLRFTFANVNDWLKFAETKNAGLFALNVASMIGLLQANDGMFTLWPAMKGISLLLLCASSICCLLSILPEVDTWFRGTKKMTDQIFNQKKAELSALFFGHIAQLSVDQFIELFQSKNPSAVIIGADKDLAFQIVNNAEITSRKFRAFNISCVLTLLGFTIGIALILMVALNK